MAAEKVIYALLTGAGPVTALVGDRIYPMQIPQDAVLPAIAYEHVDANPLPRLDAAAAYDLTQARVAVSVVSTSYADVKAVLAQVRAACKYQRGAIGGVQVVSVLPGGTGPDLRDTDMALYSQSVDFLITHHEP